MSTLTIMERIFEYIDKDDNPAAIQLIKENLAKRSPAFIENLVPSLSIITNSAVEVAEAIMPTLLGILDFDDDVIRYSIILSLRKFVTEHKELIFPYIEDFLKYGSPKKREGILLLIQYIVEMDAKALMPFVKEIVPLLADPEGFVRKLTVEILQTIGQSNRTEIEAIVLEFLKIQQDSQKQHQQDEELIRTANEVLGKKADLQIEPADAVLIQAADRALKKGGEGFTRKAEESDWKSSADQVLKSIINIDSLEKEELKKRQLEAQSKALQEKLDVDAKKLKLEKLQLQEEEKKFEQKRIAQKMEQLAHEKDQLAKKEEIFQKQQELEEVKRELELKHIEEEKQKIIQGEKDRNEEILSDIDNAKDSEDEWEELD